MRLHARCVDMQFSQSGEFGLTMTQQSKVSVLGAAGGIGQPLSLLLKLNPRVTELALYDIKGGPGMQMLERGASLLRDIIKC